VRLTVVDRGDVLASVVRLDEDAAHVGIFVENPRTGDDIRIAARRRIGFKPAMAFRDHVQR